MQRHPERDILINAGYSLPYMEKTLRLSHQAILFYMRRSGQHAHWKELRKRVELGEELETPWILPARDAQQLITQLSRIAIQRGYEESWAHGKTVEYMMAIPYWAPNRMPGARLLEVFQSYERHMHKEFPLNKVEKEVGICTTQLHRMLKKVDVSCKTKTYEKKDLRIEDVLFAREQGMSYNDIEYFSGCNATAVRNRVEKIFPNVPHNTGIRRMTIDGKLAVLTYRLASQIYEARDLAFSNEDIASLCNTPVPLVEFALDKRREIAPSICTVLRRLYSGIAITGPYLSITPSFDASSKSTL
jgi:hypothetical protein